MTWRSFFCSVAASVLVLFCAFFVLVAATIGLITVYRLVFSAGTAPAGAQLLSWLGDTAVAAALLSVFWGLYGGAAVLLDAEESPLGGGPRAASVRSPYGELATMVARNSRLKCALGFVFFALVAAMGVLIARTADGLFYVADGWLCLLAGGSLALLFAFKLADRRPQVVVDGDGVGLGHLATVGWAEIEAADTADLSTPNGPRASVYLKLRDPRAWGAGPKRFWGRPFRFDGEGVTIATGLLDVRVGKMLELIKRRRIREELRGR